MKDNTYDITMTSCNVSVASVCLHYLPAGITGENEEDNEDSTQDGEDYDPDHQVHCSVRSVSVVGPG